MPAFLLILTLAASLLAPLWSLESQPRKEGPGLDPDGLTAPAPTTDAGPGLDPFGHS
jgi:hypothetical protein